jgi:hypothetical protein
MALRVLRLEIENLKKIKVLAIEPKGNVVKISGANASGKSSTLDALMLALVGARGGPKVPVRTGADRGMVRVDLGEYVVTRQWYDKGSPKGEMWIEAKDGRRYGTPQAVLDAAMGKISFDPLAFTRMEPNQQANELRKLLDLDEPLLELKNEYDTDYTTRREIKKEVEALEAQRKTLDFPADLPAKKKNVDAMIEDLAKIADHNTAIQRERMERESTQAKLGAIKLHIDARAKEIVELEMKLRIIEQAHKALLADHDTVVAEMDTWKPLPEPKNATKLSEDIAVARATNAAIERRDRAEAITREIDKKGETVAKLSQALDDNRARAERLISEAKYPLPGLGFSEGEVLYDGLPLDQASDAQKIRLSVAIAMYGNPQLRVMRIKDGSLLDDAAMKLLEEMADEHDYQIFIEIVDTSGKVGVYLVDGEVAAIDGEPLKVQPKPTLRAARKPREKAEAVEG